MRNRPVANVRANYSLPEALHHICIYTCMAEVRLDWRLFNSIDCCLFCEEIISELQHTVSSLCLCYLPLKQPHHQLIFKQIPSKTTYSAFNRKGDILKPRRTNSEINHDYWPALSTWPVYPELINYFSRYFLGLVSRRQSGWLFQFFIKMVALCENLTNVDAFRPN